MARMGSLDTEGLRKLQEQLNKIQQNDVNAFVESCAKELAARLLAKVVKRTPVGDYSTEVTVVAKRNSKKHQKGETYTKRVNKSGKKGGTLRRGWTATTQSEAQSGGSEPNKGQVTAFVDSLRIQRAGDTLVIEIVNPVEYASCVEYGHRKKNGGWVPGQFMLTISEQEIEAIAPRVLEAKLKKFLGGMYE